jgi:hypothetical protein
LLRQGSCAPCCADSAVIEDRFGLISTLKHWRQAYFDLHRGLLYRVGPAQVAQAGGSGHASCPGSGLRNQDHRSPIEGSLAVSNPGVFKLSASAYWKSPLTAAAIWQVPWGGPRAGPGRPGRPAAGWRDPAGSQVLDRDSRRRLAARTVGETRAAETQS